MTDADSTDPADRSDPPPSVPAAPRPRGGSGGDDDTLRAVVRRYELPLTQYAARITGCRERARDAVQDTFLRFQQSAPPGLAQAEGDLPKWLFTVCRHRALDICRKENRMTYLDHEPNAAEPSPEPGPAESLARKEAANFLLRILEKLPPRQQEVIQLKFQNGLSYKEISEVTQLSVTNVGFLIHQGIKALRRQHAALAGQYIHLHESNTPTAAAAASILPHTATP